MKTNTLKIIGNEEWCAFSKLNIPAIRARVDSGAKTSSIQAMEIKLFNKNNEEWVDFIVYPIQKNNEIKVKCTAKVIDKRSIKGSFGISEERLIIKSLVTIGDETFEIELSLANRNTMEFKMLLGREAISTRFLINTAEKRLQKKYSKRALSLIYESPEKEQSELNNNED